MTDNPDMKAEVVPVTVAPAGDLTCDRCGARAWVEVNLPSGTRLAFCAHHYESSKESLIAQALRIIDHRPHLEALEAGRKAPVK